MVWWLGNGKDYRGFGSLRGQAVSSPGRPGRLWDQLSPAHWVQVSRTAVKSDRGVKLITSIKYPVEK